MTEEQKEKRREYKRNWMRKYTNEHREEIYNRNRKYRESNAEVIRKRKRDHDMAIRNHCIYLIELPDCRMYVGSTNHLAKRIVIHKVDSANHPDRPLYRAIRDVGGWAQVRVHVIMRDIPDRALRLRLEKHFINLIPEQLQLNVHNTLSQKAS